MALGPACPQPSLGAPCSLASGSPCGLRPRVLPRSLWGEGGRNEGGCALSLSFKVWGDVLWA